MITMEGSVSVVVTYYGIFLNHRVTVPKLSNCLENNFDRVLLSSFTFWDNEKNDLLSFYLEDLELGA